MRLSIIMMSCVYKFFLKIESFDGWTLNQIRSLSHHSHHENRVRDQSGTTCSLMRLL